MPSSFTAESLQPGDRFRTMHDEQMSLNGLTMDSSRVYQVVKVFAVHPNVRVCKELAGKRKLLDQIYTVPVDFPCVPPDFPRHLISSIAAEADSPRKVFVGVEVIDFNEDEKQLDRLLSTRHYAFYSLMKGSGRKFLTQPELRRLVIANWDSFSTKGGRPAVFIKLAVEALELHGAVRCVYRERVGSVEKAARGCFDED